jgi:YggT family protein
MSIFGAILRYFLDVYFYILIVRFVLELMIGVNRSWRPRGLWLVLSEIVMTVTDPPLKVVRKVVKPVRVGSAGIDFSWTVLLLVVGILQVFANSI